MSSSPRVPLECPRGHTTARTPCPVCALIDAPTEDGTPKPTAAQLEKHAARFGPAGVAETAAELGLDVRVDGAPKVKTRRGRGPTLRERVRSYIEAGHSVEVIAELENLSPSRARRLVEEVK